MSIFFFENFHFFQKKFFLLPKNLLFSFLLAASFEAARLNLKRLPIKAKHTEPVNSFLNFFQSEETARKKNRKTQTITNHYKISTPIKLDFYGQKQRICKCRSKKTADGLDIHKAYYRQNCGLYFSAALSLLREDESRRRVRTYLRRLQGNA